MRCGVIATNATLSRDALKSRTFESYLQEQYEMRVFEKSRRGLLCMLIVGVLSPVVFAQPSPPARTTPSKVGGVPVADILQRLGAKLEHGVSKKILDGYVDHFDRTDPNRDGKHTKEEYVENGLYMTPQARAGIFRAADGDADGVVTRAEYVLNRIITDEGKAIVQGMDDDKDGLVERVEFVKHATSLLSDDGLAVQLFFALDGNADGGIPIPEYLKIWGKWARAGQKAASKRVEVRQAELSDSANERTKQEDGLTGEGRRSGGLPGRPGASAGPPSVDEVFERFDGNKDGKLQKKEVPAFVQQFIFPADANDDDVVTKEELQASRQRQRPGGEGLSTDSEKTKVSSTVSGDTIDLFLCE